LKQRKSGLLRQVTSYKKLISYEIFYDRTKKGDLLIQVISWTGLTVCDLLIQVISWTGLTVCGLFEWK
jgi:hypothetical protein